jgi:hypothetical protein
MHVSGCNKPAIGLNNLDGVYNYQNSSHEWMTGKQSAPDTQIASGLGMERSANYSESYNFWANNFFRRGNLVRVGIMSQVGTVGLGLRYLLEPLAQC